MEKKEKQEDEEIEPLENIIEETPEFNFTRTLQGDDSPSIKMSSAVQELEEQIQDTPTAARTSQNNQYNPAGINNEIPESSAGYDEPSVQTRRIGVVDPSLVQGSSVQTTNPFVVQASSLKPQWESDIESGNKRKDYHSRTEESHPLERDARSRRRF